jgi:uncharacterized membrane protein
MLKRTRLQALVLVMMGALLGYAAASGQVRVDCQSEGRGDLV